MKGNAAFLVALVILIIVGLWIIFMSNAEPWRIGAGLALFIILAFFALSRFK